MIYNYMIEAFVLLVLILLSYIDLKNINLKKKGFPAVLTSGLLLVVALTKFNNIEFGLLAFILAWFLMEADFFGGVADLKIIAVMGFFISGLGMFLLFTIMIVVFGTVYKIAMVKIIKMKETDEVAFIPVLLAVAITLFIIQYLV